MLSPRSEFCNSHITNCGFLSSTCESEEFSDLEIKSSPLLQQLSSPILAISNCQVLPALHALANLAPRGENAAVERQ